MSRIRDEAKAGYVGVNLRMDPSDAQIIDEICRKERRTRAQLVSILVQDLIERYRKNGSVIRLEEEEA